MFFILSGWSRQAINALYKLFSIRIQGEKSWSRPNSSFDLNLENVARNKNSSFQMASVFSHSSRVAGTDPPELTSLTPHPSMCVPCVTEEQLIEECCRSSVIDIRSIHRTRPCSPPRVSETQELGCDSSPTHYPLPQCLLCWKQVGFGATDTKENQMQPRLPAARGVEWEAALQRKHSREY